MKSSLARFIKNKQGDKVPQKTTSINIEARHLDFLKRRNLNLSGIVRECIDKLMAENDDDKELL